MTDTHTEALVERVAKAIEREFYACVDECPPQGQGFERVARAAIEALPARNDGLLADCALCSHAGSCADNLRDYDGAFCANSLLPLARNDERALKLVDPDVRRRLLSVATTLETCGKHGVPISFEQLAHDIRAALADTQPTEGVG